MIVLEATLEPPGTALRRAPLTRFLNRAWKAIGLTGEVTVLLTTDKRIQELNRTFRHKNKPTDVLSFPAHANPEDEAGDLAISLDTAARQAAGFGHALEDELQILILHGLLHLAGFDHETDKGEMAAQESALRVRLGLSTGLIHRAAHASPQSHPNLTNLTPRGRAKKPKNITPTSKKRAAKTATRKASRA